MNSFAALNREEVGVEDLSRHVFTSPLALLLYRCSTLNWMPKYYLVAKNIWLALSVHH